MQHVDEAHVAQTLGTDPLLRLGLHPRHDQRVLLEREHLADRVIAAHGNDPVGTLDQRQRVGDELEHLAARMALGTPTEPLPLGRRHVRPRHHQAGGIGGQLGLDERLGQRMTVDPASDDAQGKLARGQVREELTAWGPANSSRGRWSRYPVYRTFAATSSNTAYSRTGSNTAGSP